MKYARLENNGEVFDVPRVLHTFHKIVAEHLVPLLLSSPYNSPRFI